MKSYPVKPPLIQPFIAKFCPFLKVLKTFQKVLKTSLILLKTRFAKTGAWPIQATNNIKNMITNNTETTPAPAEKTTAIQPLFYDIHQAALALNLSTKSVRRLVWRGRLTTCKAVRKVLIPRKQIEEFIKASCDTPKLAA